MYTKLLEHIRRYVTLTANEADVICARLTAISLKKKEFLLVPGKICRVNYFVTKGCLRLYFISAPMRVVFRIFATYAITYC